MKNWYISKVLLLVLVTQSLVSCTSMNGAVGTYFDMDTDLQVDFAVDPDINPDEMGKASPLFIRMYELKTPKMMKQADFIRIYENDKEVLGADFVAVHRLRRFKPGESRTERYVLDKQTRYVAFFAEFLKFKDAKYKVIVPVVANNVIQTSATARVTGNEISIETR
jgi:type VI secretion system protein VasD